MSVFLRPNLARTLWTTPLAAALGMAAVLLLRSLYGLEPLWNAEALLVAAYGAATFGFLIGIGGFDSWWPVDDRARRRGPRTTPSTGRTPGTTTSSSTPTTR
jgi:hypothetical protein